ncbi:hypothetical protein ACE1CD_25390 [Aerosakkonema sp. BLCC-F183]|uniref:hypothetical protein n=1 Tax=Aerosakkonema sp. BLCC-F183 TaxID=3342834 RepID=UPI0035B73F6A
MCTNRSDRTLLFGKVRSHLGLLVLNSGMGRYALSAGYANAYSTLRQPAFHNSKYQTTFASGIGRPNSCAVSIHSCTIACTVYKYK